MNRWQKIRDRKVFGAISGGMLFLLATLAWAILPAMRQPAELAGLLPQGALMTVESQDFGALVSAWNRSPEQRAWLASANYSAFTNSRLFARLAEAQEAFSGVAETGVNGQFLDEVAGKESIFAWYNIGNLELLYISHLPADRIAKLSLLADREAFARRQAAGTTFYVRTGSNDSGPADAAGQDADAAASASPSDGPRTVAFAVRGEWLVLGTREDLVAGALQLMAAQDNASQASLASAGWYAAAAGAGPQKHGDLHMLLDLQALTKTPQFRSYWIQRNVTETRQYRAAVVDLYRERDQFREERVLLPMTATDDPGMQPDLGALEQLVPERTGVFRAVAHPSAATVLDALKTKLLAREPAPVPDSTSSPVAQTAVTPVGAGDDFETRIDAPPPPPSSQDSFSNLRLALEGANVESMLTLDRTDPPEAGQIFVPIRSAVVLRTSSSWNQQTLSNALLTGLRAQLTTGNLGLAWTSAGASGSKYQTLGAAYPICLWVNGSLAIITSSPALMEDLLARSTAPPAAAMQAQVIAGFRHTEERANFRRIMTDLNVPQTADSSGAAGTQTSNAPAAVDLFRDNLPSLSDTFQSMTSEHFVQTATAGQVHQTVLYRWAASQ